MSLSMLELELMGLQQPVICCSEYQQMEHLSFFLCSVPVCRLHHSEDPVIKSHMISRNNNFNNHPFSSVPLIQLQNMTDSKVGVGMSSGECSRALLLLLRGNACWERRSGRQRVHSCRAHCYLHRFKVSVPH